MEKERHPAMNLDDSAVQLPEAFANEKLLCSGQRCTDPVPFVAYERHVTVLFEHVLRHTVPDPPPVEHIVQLLRRE